MGEFKENQPSISAAEKIDALKKELLVRPPLSEQEQRNFNWGPFVRSDVPYDLPSLELLFGNKYTNFEDRETFINSLNSVGKFVAKKVQGADFFDLGCGMYRSSAQMFACLAGAKRYIGIDARTALRPYEYFEHAGAQIESYQLGDSEMLNTLTQVESDNHTVFFISGLEYRGGGSRDSYDFSGRDSSAKADDEYLEKLKREIYRIMKDGDILIQGFTTTSGVVDKRLVPLACVPSDLPTGMRDVPDYYEKADLFKFLQYGSFQVRIFMKNEQIGKVVERIGGGYVGVGDPVGNPERYFTTLIVSTRFTDAHSYHIQHYVIDNQGKILFGPHDEDCSLIEDPHSPHGHRLIHLGGLGGLELSSDGRKLAIKVYSMEKGEKDYDKIIDV